MWNTRINQFRIMMEDWRKWKGKGFERVDESSSSFKNCFSPLSYLWHDCKIFPGIKALCSIYFLPKIFLNCDVVLWQIISWLKCSLLLIQISDFKCSVSILMSINWESFSKSHHEGIRKFGSNRWFALPNCEYLVGYEIYYPKFLDCSIQFKTFYPFQNLDWSKNLTI